MEVELIVSVVSLIFSAFAILFTGLRYRLAMKQRKDSLFELRYNFYKNVSNMWVSTCNDGDPNITDPVNLIPVAQKASFLFGEDIKDHIMTLEGNRATNPFFPDSDFDKPFYKYLKL